MKNNTLLLTALSAATIASASATAGELTGSISADWNSHFVSYGFDVWQGGSELTSADTFNPAVSLSYAINDSLSFSTGFWLDVNDNVAGSDFETQETDTWFGLSYVSGIATYSATYQSWQYAGDTEEVLDLSVSLDTAFSPSLTLHKRLDGSGSQNLGTMAVLSASHGFDVNEQLSVSIPVSVAYALSDFHQDADGYAYASVGLQGSYALNDSTSLNAGVTYYTTDSEVVGNVKEDNFITTNVGVSYSF